MRSLFFSRFFFKNKKIKDSIIVRNNSRYEMKDILLLGQNKYIQFKT